MPFSLYKEGGACPRLFRFRYSLFRKGPHSHSIIFYPVAIVLEQRMPTQIQDTQDTFLDDPLVHFRNAKLPVLEDDGHLVYLKTQLPGCELHFDLEGIAYELDLI